MRVCVRACACACACARACVCACGWMRLCWHNRLCHVFATSYETQPIQATFNRLNLSKKHVVERSHYYRLWLYRVQKLWVTHQIHVCTFIVLKSISDLSHTISICVTVTYNFHGPVCQTVVYFFRHLDYFSSCMDHQVTRQSNPYALFYNISNIANVMKQYCDNVMGKWMSTT